MSCEQKFWAKDMDQSCDQNLWKKLVKKIVNKLFEQKILVVNTNFEQKLWTKVLKKTSAANKSYKQKLQSKISNNSCEQDL